MADGAGSIFAKLKAFAARDWILIALTAIGLVVAFLIWRNSQAKSSQLPDQAGFVPAGGAGQPNWPSDGSSFGSSGLTETDYNNILHYILNSQTPNPPPTASPGLTKYVHSTQGQTLSSLAAKYGASVSDLYYNPNNRTIQEFLKRNGGIKNAGKTVLPTGTTVYLAGTSGVAA